tara:strand:- start:580 stop:741 length:162 start_codon:yes stop_codon:yes gene_type:complete
MQHHKYNLREIEFLMPWERDVYISQLIEYIEVENEKIQMADAERKQKSMSMGW